MKQIVTLVLSLFLFGGLLYAQDQLENQGFEEWEDLLISDTDTTREPVQWSSLKDSDNPQLSAFAPVVCKRSTDAHSGKYSVELFNVQSLVVANGVATNGRIHPDIVAANAYTYTDPEDSNWHTAFTSRPDSIVGWYKYTYPSSDTLQVKVCLHKGFGKQPDPDSLENWIGVGEFLSSLNTDDEWIRFSAPFRYMSDEVPEYALVVLNSGGKVAPVAGSRALFDDLEMIYNSSSVEPLAREKGPFIAVTGSQTLWLQNMALNLYRQLDVYDISGKRVWSEALNSNRIDLGNTGLNKGIYIVNVKGPDRFYNQKIILY
jgi:hypothetical protein